MHLSRTLRFVLIAGTLAGSGRRPERAWRAAATPGGTGPPRAVSAAVPPPDRRPEAPTETGITFLDLISAGLIEVTAHGATSQRVEVSIENREGIAISFDIPIGTFFDSGGTRFRSMITTYDATVSLRPHGAWTDRIRAAYESFGPRRPMPFDTFQGIRELSDPRLAAALRALDRHGAGRFCRQAAVWIMTSDARWDGFGTRFSGETRVPYASEDEAALAMVALDLNGVDITTRAIWEDVPMLRAGVVDPDLKTWLELRC
jgi:hypothetical protein